MFKIYRKELMWGGRKLTLETGRIARQADGAVLATYGETVVLCTAVGAKQPKPGIDFFPLTVNYQEKTFAAGKIPGGFFKREGRPTEKEVLTSRLIDRPIRPLFHSTYRNETQVVCTTLSHDLENDPDIVALIGASAALTISGIPFLGPIGAARVGFINGEYVINPKRSDLSESKLDLVLAGTSEGVLMVESEAQELSEEVMLGAVNFGFQSFQPVINAIIELAEQCAKDPRELTPPDAAAAEVYDALQAQFSAKLTTAYQETAKQARTDKVAAVKDEAKKTLGTDDKKIELVGKQFKELEKNIVRGNILKTGLRIDGRDTKTVRPITAEVGILPRAHGSALFTRGETQALVVTTLGTGDDEQIIDALEGEFRETFMLHYNFPPYSTGEAGRMGFAGPPRNRPWQARLARRASDAAKARMSSPTPSASSPRSPNPTAPRRWPRSAVRRSR
jgi:polyribonucleotide nucleotidyltransferase